MNKFLYRFCEISLYLYPDTLIRYTKILRRYTSGIIIKHKLGKSGKYVLVVPPIDLKGGKYISVGENFSARSGMILKCWDQYESESYQPRIIIGNNAEFGINNHIGCIDKILIGDNILTGSNVHITDHNHGSVTQEDSGIPPIKRKLFSKGPVKIGNNVWLGDNVIVLPGVEIGDNVIVGANSVVTKSIPSNCVAVGVPARVIKRMEKEE